MKRWFIMLAGLAGLLVLGGCLMRDVRWAPVRPPSGAKPSMYRLEVTGYCPCEICCGWTRTWYGKPVIAYGPNKGKPKAVGITASGAKARRGTIAADTSIFPFGTVMYVPGYGYGVVEDRGGAIKGYKIDLYFSSHQTAREWGRVRREVKVWLPPEQRRK
ncbi:MAG TPA: 3D domain-containing protein [Kiritimatiellia bacterium]|nr:3D domain-containing protein [Kiritimatiellia bacterium]HMO97784.1 3D domain-containing protein [Kiritimatiellia bacterium]HMP98068.1 3D domain-containing protein [Kiritimatiellia bacterium]